MTTAGWSGPRAAFRSAASSSPTPGHRLEQSLGHEPSLEELAAELDLTLDAVKEAQVAASNLRPASLDATTADGGRPVLDLIDGRADALTDPGLDEGIVVRTALQRLAPATASSWSCASPAT